MIIFIQGTPRPNLDIDILMFFILLHKKHTLWNFISVTLKWRETSEDEIPLSDEWMACFVVFTALSTVFQSDQAGRRMILKDCMQENSV